MPDNAIFYQIAYAAAAVIYGGYIVSIFVRTKRARERQRQQKLAGVAPRTPS
jgi:hypothetical protein